MPDHDDALQTLIEVMSRTPRPLALLGAGTSLDSGYPDWNGLLALLEQRAKGIGPKYKIFLRGLNDPAWQAEEYRQRMGDREFKSLISSVFAPKKTVGPILQTIVSLQFRHVLTTNYDSGIEQAYMSKDSPLKITDWTQESEMRQFFLDLSKHNVTPHLVYLHGRYYDPENVILTESSYAKRYVRSEDANRKLFAILITQPVVFIGFSVNDPDVNHLMREVNARLGSGIPQHFALMGYEVDEQRQLIRNRFEGKYGIRPVFYRITRNADNSENHSDLLVLLDKVRAAIHGEDDLRMRSIPPPGEARTGRVVDETTTEPTISVVIDALDQQKGQWGGKSERDGRRLRVENIDPHQKINLCYFDLVLESTDANFPPLTGPVIFHLHQTFYPPTETVQAKDGKARLEVNAYGAFTVGVEADAGSTRLELDLATLESFPEWFRDR